MLNLKICKTEGSYEEVSCDPTSKRAFRGVDSSATCSKLHLMMSRESNISQKLSAYRQMEGRKVQFVEKNIRNNQRDNVTKAGLFPDSTQVRSFQNVGEEIVKLLFKTENDVTTLTKSQTHISEILPRVKVKLLVVEVRSEILLLTTLIFLFFTLCYYIDILFVRQSISVIQVKPTFQE